MEESLKVYNDLISKNVNVYNLGIVHEYITYLENNDIETTTSTAQKVLDLENIKELYLKTDNNNLYDLIAEYMEKGQN
jgi:hypothetical protein